MARLTERTELAEQPDGSDVLHIVDVSASSSKKITVTNLLSAATGGYTQSFTDANLISGVLTVTHNLNNKFVNVSVYNHTDDLVIPDNIRAYNVNTTIIDLSGVGSLIGQTWNVVIK
jgi:hypothetical protein